jgi:ABC-type dipeptide/oligopeptide/nickel transport system ATPase component
MIMRHGVVVELGPTELVFGNPFHPYTKSLLACVPQLHKKWRDVEADLATAPAAPDGASRAAGGAMVEVEAGHFVMPAADDYGAAA